MKQAYRTGILLQDIKNYLAIAKLYFDFDICNPAQKEILRLLINKSPMKITTDNYKRLKKTIMAIDAEIGVGGLSVGCNPSAFSEPVHRKAVAPILTNDQKKTYTG